MPIVIKKWQEFGSTSNFLNIYFGYNTIVCCLFNLLFLTILMIG
jgi:hypothetical protein